MSTKLTALCLVIVLAGCDGQATPPPSGGPSGSGSVASGSVASGTASSAPDTSADPVTGIDPILPLPLPAPSLTEGGAIGQALYDPGLVPDGVVSLFDLAGVQITTADGAVIRAGTGALSMTEDEVRGAIRLTYDELAAGTDAGVGPGTVADLYNGLASALPAGYTVDQFAQAYSDAYAEAPETLAAGVMLGMPITPETRLLTVQAWLLLVDGFVARRDGASTALARAPAAGPREIRFTMAQDRGNLSGSGIHTAGLAPLGPNNPGTAAPRQPALRSPIPTISGADWADLLAALPWLAGRVPFSVQGAAAVHEGHGRLGPRLQLSARIGRPLDIVSLRTGAVLLPAANPGDGVPMMWHSEDPSILQDHGQVLGQLDWPVLTDASGTVQIGYQVKQERAVRRILNVYEDATLTARVERRDLVVEAWTLPPEVYSAMTAGKLITGQREAEGGDFPIQWHEEDGLRVYIENRYDYTFMVGGIAKLHRKGYDKVSNELWYSPTSKTYRGILHAWSLGHADGTAQLALGGIAQCDDDEHGDQRLFVVGRTLDAGTLALQFFPLSPPEGDFSLCQPTIPYRGTDRFRMLGGAYLPLNDTRWTSGGFTIDIPASKGAHTEYHDISASSKSVGVCSDYYVWVYRFDPADPSGPAASPVPSGFTC